uniref:adenylate kinase 7-like n=1 Tax=Centroberyx gerrardi TaxID=166262 RepID=UPI003AABC027
MGDEKEHVWPRRIFVNNVDSYSSKFIAKFLSTCIAGESSDDAEADEDTTLATPRDERTGTFQIVGTVSSSSTEEKASFLLEQYTSPTRDQLLQCLLECDVVVYNVSENATEEQIEEATWAITALHAEMENFSSQKMFILVSTVMTWALTKPRDLDDADAPLTDEDYRRKRPHPNFKNHSTLEKLVLKLGRTKKSKLTGYVVAGGLQYGKGENLFHYFFKVSWSVQFPKVPVFGPGTNHIPMIHVYDLGGVIQNIIDLKPKSQYILAVDDSKNTLEDVVKMISYALGPGKINQAPEQEAILMKALKPEELEYLSINLHLEPVLLKETFNLRWTSEAGMIENMDRIVEEYKDTRQLLPIRICLTGPPAVGKTTVAEKLCQHYQVHHIKLKEVIEEKITQLEEILSGADREYVNEEAVAAAQDQLQTIHNSMEKNAGRLADHLVFHILYEKLNSKPCRNQGFVLDGFPKTYEQAKVIFSDDDMEYEDLKSKAPMYNKKITPEYVFALDASDDFLMKRAQAIPQSVAEKMRYTQDEFVPRLARYRQVSASEETLLDYFDELEIHPEHIDDPEYAEVIKKITEVVGIPRNYGLSPEEQVEEDRRLEEERQHKLAREAAEKKRRDTAALAELAAQYEEWNRNVLEVKRQEYELLEAHCLPLRSYLMKYVMPSLTEAMLDCCKAKPDDPVDFLAEHLLQSNQQN